MLAMFFFLALYMQNVKGYSPLEAGVRFLPATMMIIVVAPLAGRLTDRIGPGRSIISGNAAGGRVTVLAGPPVRRYRPTVSLAGAFVLMGIGMGLVMSPMTTAGMNAVEQSKAGVASGILSTEPHGRRDFRRRRDGSTDHRCWPPPPGPIAARGVLGPPRSAGGIARQRRCSLHRTDRPRRPGRVHSWAQHGAARRGRRRPSRAPCSPGCSSGASPTRVSSGRARAPRLSAHRPLTPGDFNRQQSSIALKEEEHEAARRSRRTARGSAR